MREVQRRSELLRLGSSWREESGVFSRQCLSSSRHLTTPSCFHQAFRPGDREAGRQAGEVVVKLWAWNSPLEEGSGGRCVVAGKHVLQGETLFSYPPLWQVADSWQAAESPGGCHWACLSQAKTRARGTKRTPYPTTPIPPLPGSSLTLHEDIGTTLPLRQGWNMAVSILWCTRMPNHCVVPLKLI